MTMTAPPTYEPCAQCSAPLGDNQRYCVVCGTNRRHPEDPVARYLANAALGKRVRAAQATPRPAPAGGDGRWVAVALALLPLAAGIGVIVGKDGGSGSDDKLLAALRNRPAAIAAGGTAAAATTALPSDFGLDKGYAVELGTLPWDTTTAASAAKARSAAEAKGAKGVGLINPDDFSLTPGSDGDYVLYSGEYRSRGQAEKALAKLRKRFPDAKVVKVGASRSGSSSSGGATAAGNGKLTTSDAVATQRHPTAQQKQQGAEIVKQIQANKGKSYVQQQRQLPDTIVVP